jgi:hypothetical protein
MGPIGDLLAEAHPLRPEFRLSYIEIVEVFNRTMNEHLCLQLTGAVRSYHNGRS